MLTEGEAVVAQRFAKEAVELPHVAQRGGRPALGYGDCLYFFSEGRDELRLLREVVERVRDGLNAGEGRFKLPSGSSDDDDRTHL